MQPMTSSRIPYQHNKKVFKKKREKFDRFDQVDTTTNSIWLLIVWLRSEKKNSTDFKPLNRMLWNFFRIILPLLHFDFLLKEVDFIHCSQRYLSGKTWPHRHIYSYWHILLLQVGIEVMSWPCNVKICYRFTLLPILGSKL